MRIKSGVTTRRHKKKYFKLAKGYYSDKHSRWRQVKQQPDVRRPVPPREPSRIALDGGDAARKVARPRRDP